MSGFSRTLASFLLSYTVDMRKFLALACMLAYAGSVARAETFLVLPFFNRTNNASLDWIGESIAESVREAMAAEGEIVLDRDDRNEAYRRLAIRPYSRLTKASVFVVGEALDAAQVVYGSFELLPAAAGTQSRGSLRITAQILDLARRSAGPEYVELGALEDLTRLQGHLAWQTLQFLVPSGGPSEQEFQKRQLPLRVEAIENYIRGLVATSDEQKLRFYQQAVRIEPQYSQANFEIGQLYYRKKNHRAAAEHLSKVSALDSHYRESLFMLGLCRFNLGDYDAAQNAFLTISQDVPLNEVWNNLASAQSRGKNLDSALKNFDKALEGDPNDPDYLFNSGYALYKAGQVAKAAERFRQVLDRVPGDPVATTMLGRCLKGRAPGPADLRASENLERLKERYEESAYRQLKAVLEKRK